MKRVAIDIDGVLADTVPTLNEFYNELAGTNFEIGDYKYHDLEKTWGGTKEEVVGIVDYFYQSPEFLDIMPIVYSREVVTALSIRRELFSVTSRPDKTRGSTENFLEGFYGNSIRCVFYTGQYGRPASKTDKLGVCVEYGADVLIEDCLEVAISVAEGGVKVYLLDNHWNQLNGHKRFRLPGNLIRVENWLEILDQIK